MVDEKQVNPPPGTYTARIVNYGVKKTKSGDPAPTIAFEVELADKSKHRVFWQGSFNGGGREITAKALLVCGLKDVRAFTAGAMARGVDTKLLDTTKDVNIVVIHETSQDGANRYAKVQWINEAGGGRFKNAIEQAEAGMLFQGMGLEADFFRIAQENGYKLGGAPVVQAVPPPLADADIPF